MDAMQLIGSIWTLNGLGLMLASAFNRSASLRILGGAICITAAWVINQ